MHTWSWSDLLLWLFKSYLESRHQWVIIPSYVISLQTSCCWNPFRMSFILAFNISRFNTSRLSCTILSQKPTVNVLTIFQLCFYNLHQRSDRIIPLDPFENPKVKKNANTKWATESVYWECMKLCRMFSTT